MDDSLDDTSYPELIRNADLTTHVRWPDRVIATLNAVPWIGGVIAAWASQNRQQVVTQRIRTCLLSVVAKLERIEYDLTRLDSDEQFAELSIPILEKAARTLSEDKRECFANMLANAAIRDSMEEREKVYSMAALLDQMDFAHVAVLDRLLRMPAGRSVLFFGAVRTVPGVDVRQFSKEEHYAMGALEDMGLIDMSDLREHLEQFVGDVDVRGRGIALHQWITEPSKNEGAHNKRV